MLLQSYSFFLYCAKKTNTLFTHRPRKMSFNTLYISKLYAKIHFLHSIQNT